MACGEIMGPFGRRETRRLFVGCPTIASVGCAKLRRSVMCGSVCDSDQERLKQADDAINKFRHLLKCWNDRLTFDNLRLSERYIKSQLEIIVRLSVVGFRGKVDDFIAHHERHFGPTLEGNDNSSASIHRPFAKTAACGNEDAVLVDAVQFMDIPKSAVPTCVRLYREQDFFRANPYLVYFSLADSRCVLLGGLADRKVGFPIGGTFSCLDQLPSKMIEGASEIMNGIADNDGEIIGNRASSCAMKISKGGS